MVFSSLGRAHCVRLARIALSAAALAALGALAQLVSPAEAKTPGSTYCFYGKCHRVKTIDETQALVGVEEIVYASHYDDCKRDRYNPCGLTSSGEQFHADRADNTASPIYPDGTTLLVWSPDTERALVVRVNNAGPYWGNRKLDLSRAAAAKLGFEHRGVAKVHVRVIKAPEPHEARYVRNRVYPPVPGDIGQYASLEAAQTGMAVALALQATAASPLAPVTTANAFGTGSPSGVLVAEAPQALGRGSKVAAASYRSTPAPQTFGALLAQSQGQLRAQSLRHVAALGAGANQSAWNSDVSQDDDAPIVIPDKPQVVVAASEQEKKKKRSPDTSDVKFAAVPNAPKPERAEAAKHEPKPEPVKVAKVEEVKIAAAEREPLKSREDARAAKRKASGIEVAKADVEPEKKGKSKRASRREKKNRNVADASGSRKHAGNDTRSRGARTAGWSRRAERADYAYAQPRVRREAPSRSTEQITSLGIRAQSSSSM